MQIWRVRLSGRIAAVLILCLWLALTLGITLGVDATAAALAIVWATTVAVAVGGWRWAYVPYIGLGADSIIVQNRLGHDTIRYSDIATVRAGYYGITITKRNRSRTVAWAVQKSNYARWRHKHTRADDLVAEIESRLPRERKYAS